jgi:glycosyltransferase involved in cell wall biosynthesis
MRILILGYSGHILDVDLANKLAKSGSRVRHIQCEDYITGKADFHIPEELIGFLDFGSISLNNTYNRYQVFRRIMHEIRLARKFFKEIRIFQPEYIITSNVPLFASYLLTKNLIKGRIPYIVWWQDVYSEAINQRITKNARGLRIKYVTNRVSTLEKFILKNAHFTVAISEKFLSVYIKWDLDEKKFSVLPNWAPPDEFIDMQGTELFPYRYVLYAGTLGMKHNPHLLLGLAERMEALGMKEKVVVISQGLGRNFLELSHVKPDNLILKDFLPVEDLKNFLKSADIALAILEPSASEYSVPSKIMTYLAAGKATVAAIPKDNPAAKYIEDSGSGIVVDPLDEELFSSTVIKLLNNQILRSQMEINARQFAADNFSGEKAAKAFIKLMD